jgi:lysyl-tRNA synthetase class 2
MLEFYQAYANYHDLMKLSEELIIFVAKEVNGTTITHFNGNEIDLSKWTKLSMREAIIKWLPSKADVLPTHEDFKNLAKFATFLSRLSDCSRGSKMVAFHEMAEQGFKASSQAVGQGYNPQEYQAQTSSLLGRLIASTFELLAEEHLIQPHIIYDFPLAVSPLSKKKPDEPDWVERFEFYIGGFEVGNAFSELNDPVDQLARFEQQMSEKDRGDSEAMDMDEDYVRALGYGLPPTAGEGIGIDRLTMLLTDSRSIRDVILFPLLRPQMKQVNAQETHGESAE